LAIFGEFLLRFEEVRGKVWLLYFKEEAMPIPLGPGDIPAASGAEKRRVL